MNTRKEANPAAMNRLDPLTLPSGWMWVDFNDVTEIIPTTGKKIKEADYLPTGPLPIVDQGKDIVGGYTDHTDHRVECIPPVIVFGDHTRALKYINFDFAAGADGIKVIKPLPVFEPKLMYYFLQAVELPNRGYSRHFQFLRKIQLPLPPLPEQHRIVAEIETQFSRLDAGVAALKRVQAALRRYKASVLKAACEGRLVPTEAGLARVEDCAYESGSALLARILAERRARWERANPGKRYVEPKGVDGVGLVDLPEGWVWASLEQLSWDAGYGTSQKCDYDAKGPPVIRIPNIVSGTINTADMKYATQPDELRQENSLVPDDLLIIRTNGSRDLIGRSALVRHTLEGELYFASYLIRYRLLNVGGAAGWVAAIWDSAIMRIQIEQVAATTAGQYNVSVRVLNRLTIPLPPLTEQHRIVAEVERRLSVAQEVESAVAASLKRAERLRQSILKQAFAGRLASRAGVGA